MLYNIYTGFDLVAVVLGKQQAEALAAQLTSDYPHCKPFTASERNANDSLTHWVDASFCD